MIRPTILALLASVSFAQNPAGLFNKPPAEVDRALRARISEFYQFHVKQQFRQAEALVAEDTKDFFYSHNKPQYLSFEIKSIDYSENFTHAKATMVVEQYVMMPGFTDKPMKIPVPSTWKLEGGKWCWYVDPDSLRESPFGKLNPGPGAPGSLPTNLMGVGDVLNKVKADTKAVSLAPGESAQVKLTNTAPGRMDLKVVGAPAGIEAKLDRAQINANEIATLTVEAGKDAKAGAIGIRVEQTSETITVQANVK